MFSLYENVKSTLYNLAGYEDKLYDLNYEWFDDVLEYIPKNTQRICAQNIIDNALTSTINEFCGKLDNKKLLISLSGGVDSMVLITILAWFEYDIVAAHINYNNRPESVREQIFLEEWCHYNNIKLYVKSIEDIKRNNVKRSDYEAITKQIRLEFYKEIIEKENINYVLLAHHKDDIIENIFANICRGRNILDLAVIREHANISNINFARPMLPYYKSVIYEFAEKYQVPYFKDTTPDWSIRGKYRNVISPAIEDAFTQSTKENLMYMSDQADQWNSLIEKQIIKPFLENVKYTYSEQDTTVQFNIQKYADYPIAFWSVILMNIFNNLGHKSPSRKAIETFSNTIKYKLNSTNPKYAIALGNCRCVVCNNNLTIYFTNTK